MSEKSGAVAETREPGGGREDETRRVCCCHSLSSLWWSVTPHHPKKNLPLTETNFGFIQPNEINSTNQILNKIHTKSSLKLLFYLVLFLQTKFLFFSSRDFFIKKWAKTTAEAQVQQTQSKQPIHKPGYYKQGKAQLKERPTGPLNETRRLDLGRNQGGRREHVYKSEPSARHASLASTWSKPPLTTADTNHRQPLFAGDPILQRLRVSIAVQRRSIFTSERSSFSKRSPPTLTHRKS